MPDISALLSPQPATIKAEAKKIASFLFIQSRVIIRLEYFIEMQSYYFFYQAMKGAYFIMSCERLLKALQVPENFLPASNMFLCNVQ